MKKGLFLWATLTLSSALYAQQPLTRQTVEDVFAQYNPQLMARASSEEDVRLLLEKVITAYMNQQPQDTLENRYTLIAWVRNFQNSLTQQTVTEQYQRAVLYALMGDAEVQASARAYARRTLLENYARIWAVSVQVKEDLLAQYKKLRKEVPADKNLIPAEQKARASRLDRAITALQADIELLRTKPGTQLVTLTDQALASAEEQVRAGLSALEADSSDNLQIKTKHKKPVAE